jgi:hypothetical protein
MVDIKENIADLRAIIPEFEEFLPLLLIIFPNKILETTWIIIDKSVLLRLERQSSIENVVKESLKVSSDTYKLDKTIQVLKVAVYTL